MTRRSRWLIAAGCGVLLAVSALVYWQIGASKQGPTPWETSPELATEILAGHERLWEATRRGAGHFRRWREEPLAEVEQIQPFDPALAPVPDEYDFYLDNNAARLDHLLPSAPADQRISSVLLAPAGGFQLYYEPGLNSAIADYDAAASTIDGLLRNPLAAATGRQQDFIARLLESPRMRLTREPVEGLAEAVVLQGQDEQNQLRVVLDPSRDFAIRSIESQVNEGPIRGTMIERIEVVPAADGQFVPGRVESVCQLTIASYREVTEIDWHSHAAPDPHLLSVAGLMDIAPHAIDFAPSPPAPLEPFSIRYLWHAFRTGAFQAFAWPQLLFATGVLAAAVWAYRRRLNTSTAASSS